MILFGHCTLPCEQRVVRNLARLLLYAKVKARRNVPPGFGLDKQKPRALASAGLIGRE